MLQPAGPTHLFSILPFASSPVRRSDFFIRLYSGEIDNTTGFSLIAFQESCYVWQHSQVGSPVLLTTTILAFSYLDRRQKQPRLATFFHVHTISIKPVLRFTNWSHTSHRGSLGSFLCPFLAKFDTGIASEWVWLAETIFSLPVWGSTYARKSHVLFARTYV